MKKKKKIAAFTILEALVVLALLGILTAFFFGTLNRFGEQMKNEVTIKNELNNWFAFRANLIREMDQVDSLSTTKDKTSLFIGSKKITYTVEENQLFREQAGEKINLQIPMNAILEKENNRTEFHFNWKEEDMRMEFSVRLDLKAKINHYFNEEPWK